MDLVELKKRFENCECGRVHGFDLEVLEISSGAIFRVGEILEKGNFPKRILLVADENSFRVTNGLYERLLAQGYTVELRVYESTKVADMEKVKEIEVLLSRVDGVLSVGTGSVNDVCRLASYNVDKPLAIVATAPSMDGFASDSAPITTGYFKTSHYCRQPKIIIADTKILAEAPVELKAAGFGDVIAKYIAVADWRIAEMFHHGDNYCDRVVQFVRDAVAKMVALADKVTENSEEAAGAVMETLVLTGLAMQLVRSSRAASGTEHIISHFWECKKLVDGIISDYHGKKVGVATLIVAKAYHNLTKIDKITAHKENIDWEEVKAHYGEALADDMMKLNLPHTIVDEIDPAEVEAKWEEIKQVIKEEVPTYETLLDLYKKAGAVTTGEEISVSPKLFEEGIKYHIFMRRRVTIARLLPMVDLDLLTLYKK